MFKKKWHLILVKKNWENRVSKTLTKNNIEIFLPLISGAKTNWLDKRTEVLTPLFPSLLFANIEYPAQYDQVKQTRGVRNFFYRLSEPAIISQQDIDAIKLFIKMYRNISYGKTYVPSLVTDEKKLLLQKDEAATETIHNNEDTMFLPSLGFYLTGKLIRTYETTTRMLQGENNVVNRSFVVYRNEENKKTEITVAS